MRESDALQPDRLKGLPYRLVHFESIGSTNDAAREHIASGEPSDGVCIVADEQTAGRGTAGRVWASGEGGLWCSLILANISEFMPVHLWASVGIHAALERELGPEIERGTLTIKWPNDVLLGGRKIAGVLIETIYGSDNSMYHVIGMGINVNQPELEPEIESTAVTLRSVSGREHNVLDLLASVLRSLAARRSSPEQVRSEWLDRSGALGSRVRIGSSEEPFVVRGLTSNGALVVSALETEHQFMVVHSATGTSVCPVEGSSNNAGAGV